MEKDLELVRRHLAQLSEHFDTVQIFASRHEPAEDRTVAVKMGSGNWFARYGQVRDFVSMEERGDGIEDVTLDADDYPEEE